jgi:metallo-beta-lactamase family protein
MYTSEVNMKLQFLGAAGQVTGSSYLLTSNSGQSILIDCGLFQGDQELDKLNYLPLDCDVKSISGMILTHAHLDHCGRLPRLLRQEFNAPIYMTAPTKDITEISLFDSAKIAKHSNKEELIYEDTDVNQIINFFKTVEYETEFSIGDFKIIFRDAGHILGSASLEIKVDNQKIVFSGDLGNTPQDIIRPTELINEGDIVVMESTYGDKEHPKEDPSLVLQSEINAIEESGGTLLIPAFSIERAQELLHKIGHLKKDGKIRDETAIVFDSPMGEKVTQVFERYKEYYNPEFKKDSIEGDLFSFPGLHVIDNRAERRVAEESQEAKVIIAGSGMMNGGTILNYALEYLPLESTRILFVGYQAENTLGRKISEGEKNVYIEGQPITIKANVNQTQAMSSHADQPRLLDWLKNIKGVKKVFLTHGEDPQRQVLSGKIKEEIGINDVILPILNQIEEI